MSRRSDDELIGYADPLVAMPGEAVSIMVSTSHREYHASLVRLCHGDDHPAGPGFQEQSYAHVLDAVCEGRLQRARPGSYGVVETADQPTWVDGVTIAAKIWPTTPATGQRQTVVSTLCSRHGGFDLALGEDGRVIVQLSTAGGSAELTTPHSLQAHVWYGVAVTIDPHQGQMTLATFDLAPLRRAGDAICRRRVQTGPPPPCGTVLLGARSPARRLPGCAIAAPTDFFNGKIEQPTIYARAASRAELQSIVRGENPVSMRPHVAAKWDFAQRIGSDRFMDRSPNRLDGRLVNNPARAVTGANWDGSQHSWRHAPKQYAAIHFHEDDLADAEWSQDLGVTVPADLPSGVFAVKLTVDDATGYVPFVVSARRSERPAPVRYLASTMTWLAYANHRFHQSVHPAATELGVRPHDLSRILDHHPEWGSSLYDEHRDGSGVMYSSWRRPLIDLDPRFRHAHSGMPGHLALDLHVIAWLAAKGYTFDLITDHDLHDDGSALLEDSKVLVTSPHPEYVSGAMVDAVERFIARGGRVLYLGGNGFYWVSAIDAHRRWIMEVRRGVAGTRPWESLPGELYLSSSGELGGKWRHRGRPPNAVLGVGYSGIGFVRNACGYRRTPSSHEPEFACFFDGIQSETFGDHGLVNGGAASVELDSAEQSRGTPPSAVVLASARPRSRYVVISTDDVHEITPASALTSVDNPAVRADVTYFDTESGGAVFAASAIGWAGSMVADGYENDVSRLTQNVLDTFLGMSGAAPPIARKPSGTSPREATLEPSDCDGDKAPRIEDVTRGGAELP